MNKTITSIVCSLGFCGVAFAQGNPAVDVPVAVVNAQGQPVPGLAANHFQLAVDGKQTPISGVQQVQVAAVQPLPLNAAFSSNMNVDPASNDNRVVLLLDFVNMNVGNYQGTVQAAQYLQKNLALAMQNSLPMGEPLGVYGLAPKLTQFGAFTPNRNALNATLGLLSSWMVHTPGKDQAQSATGKFPILMSSGIIRYVNAPDTDVQTRGFATLNGLKDLARVFRGRGGHTTVIWLTHDLTPVIPGDVISSTDVNRTIDALNDANVSLYPVDIVNVEPSVPDALRQYNPANANLMRTFANRTGGALLAGSGFEGTISQAVREWSNFYDLKFDPSSKGNDSRTNNHSLRVTVNAGQHAQVLARQVYTSRPVPYEKKNDQVKKALRWAQDTPVVIGTIPMILQVPPPAAGANSVPFTVYVPPSAILGSGNQYDYTVQVSLQNAVSNKEVSLPAQHFARQLSAADAQAFGKHLATYQGQLSTTPGQAFYIVAIVRNNLNGEMGKMYQLVQPAAAKK